MYGFSADSILLVLASERYDAGEYIRNFGELKKRAAALLAAAKARGGLVCQLFVFPRAFR